MELRSRRGLNPNTAAAAETPDPAPSPIATSQDQQRASFGRSATEPPIHHMREDQQDIHIEGTKEISAPRAFVLEATRTNFPVVPAPRAQSTPVTLTLLPQDQAFEILGKKIGTRLSAEEFATYRALISDRVTLVVDDSSRRIRNTWELQEFLAIQSEVLDIHNQFARSYNKTKSTIFHLPRFQPRVVRWHGTRTVTNTALTGRQVKVTNINQPSVVKLIIERTMEMSKADDGKGVNHVIPRDIGGIGNLTSVPEILLLKATTPSQGDVSMDRPDDERELFEGGEASSKSRYDDPPSGDQATQQREQEEQIISAAEPIVALTSSQHAQALRVSADERAARPERAPAYLAWLQHRQARFPTARPNSSECVLVAKKLGRPSVAVYEDVLHHWSLETDSRRGEWYKQNRSQALGEDPRFDAENMSAWKAWLKQGRDEMERKNSAMEVGGDREE